MICVCILSACSNLKLFESGAEREFNDGLTLFNAGHYEQAIPRFVKAAELDPDFAQAYIYLGRSYVSLNKWSEALPPLRAALRLSPAETKKQVVDILIDALFAAATNEFKNGNFQSSIDHLREGLSLDSQSDNFKSELAEALVAYGEELMAGDNYSEAIRTYGEVIRLSPNDFRAYFGLAGAYLQEGDFRKAVEAIQKAVLIDPNNKEAQSLLLDIIRH